MECARCEFFTQHAFFSRPHGTPLRLDLDSFAGSANKAQFDPLDDSGSYILPRLVRQIDHPVYVTGYGDDYDYDPYDDYDDDTGDSDDYYYDGGGNDIHYDGDNCNGGCINQMFCIEASEMVCRNPLIQMKTKNE
jgi:hypothetical protein